MLIYHFSSLVSRLAYYIVIVSAILIPLRITTSLFAKKGVTKRKIRVISIAYTLILSITIAFDKTVLVKIAFAILLISWTLNHFLLLEGTRRFKIVLSIGFYITLVPIESISATIVSVISLLFPQLHITSLGMMRGSNNLSAILICLCEIFTMHLLYFIFLKHKKQDLSFIDEKIIAFIAIPIFVTLIIANIGASLSITWTGLIVLVVIAIFVCAVCSVIFYKGLCYLAQEEKAHLEKEQHIKEIHQEIKHLHAIEKEYKKLYRWNHDIGNHLNSISYLVDKKEYKQAEEYIRELLDGREMKY